MLLKEMKLNQITFEFLGYYFLNILEIIFTCFFFYGALCKLFNWKMVKLFSRLWMLFNNNLSTFSTTSSIFIAICLAIFPILLSMDSNSLLIKLDRKHMIELINEIGRIFILSMIFVLLPLFKKIVTNYFIEIILLALFFILIIEIIRIMLYFYIIIYNGTKYRKNSVHSNEVDQQHILDLVQKIYDEQRTKK